MTSAKKAVEEAIDKGEEVKTVTDSEGNEFKQRPFDIHEAPKPVKRRAGRRVNVISLCGAKLFLSDGFIMPHEEKKILETDYRILGEKVRKIS